MNVGWRELFCDLPALPWLRIELFVQLGISSLWYENCFEWLIGKPSVETASAELKNQGTSPRERTYSIGALRTRRQQAASLDHSRTKRDAHWNCQSWAVGAAGNTKVGGPKEKSNL
jgi:hypothetical protein